MSEAGYFPLNTTVVQGDDLPYTIYFTQNSVPLDVSTWDFFLTVKAAYADLDTNALSQLQPTDFTVANGDGTNDKVTFMVPRADIALITVGTAYQDLQVIRSGVLTTIGKGQFVVEEQVTIREAAP